MHILQYIHHQLPKIIFHQFGRPKARLSNCPSIEDEELRYFISNICLKCKLPVVHVELPRQDQIIFLRKNVGWVRGIRRKCSATPGNQILCYCHFVRPSAAFNIMQGLQSTWIWEFINKLMKPIRSIHTSPQWVTQNILLRPEVELDKPLWKPHYCFSRTKNVE